MYSHVVVITGANRGIGLETCSSLARSLKPPSAGGGPAVICMTSRDKQSGLAAVQRVQQLLDKRSDGASVEVAWQQLDVSSLQSISRAVQAIEAKFRRCDVLINNAGVYENGWNRAVFEKTIATNLVGPIHLTEHLLPLMSNPPPSPSQHEEFIPRVINLTSGLGALDCQDQAVRRWLTSGKVRIEDMLKMKFDELPWKTSPSDSAGTPVYNLSKACISLATKLLQHRVDNQWLATQ